MTTSVCTTPHATFTSENSKWSLLAALKIMLATRRQRAALRVLDDNALADMGLNRAQADAEAARPVWDVPAGWRR
jgi:uncharacterized protein YjiS (DUF1127 family)